MTASSYGYRIINPNNSELVVDQDTVTPLRFGKASIGSQVNIDTNMYVHGLSGIPSGDYLAFMYLPNTDVSAWYSLARGISGNAYIPAADGLYVRATSSTYTLPEIYYFSLTNHATASGTYGVVIYNPAGTLVFDSRLSPLNIISMPGPTSINHTTSTTLALGTIPTKPGIMPPSFWKEVWTNTGGSTSTIDTWITFVRRNNANFFNRMYQIGTGTEDVGGSSVTYEYGDKTNVYIPIINAASYD